MSENMFNEGDRVIVTEGSRRDFVGKVGTVISIKPIDRFGKSDWYLKSVDGFEYGLMCDDGRPRNGFGCQNLEITTILPYDTQSAQSQPEPAQPSEADALRAEVARPTIVCLCGSTRFSEAFQKANLNETLAGRIVLTIGCDMKADHEIFEGMSEDELTQVKTDLDKLHFAKIDLADEVLILNVGGYIGQSTTRELAYAKGLGKRVRYLEFSEAKP